MDLSTKCYLFCEFNSVRIGHSIQNEVSLERSIFAADIVTDQFINLNWKLTGSREEYIHRAIWDGNDPNRPKGLFIPVWREIHWSKILTLTSWQLTNRTMSDISRLSRHSICQSFFSRMNLYYDSNPFRRNKSTSTLRRSRPHALKLAPLTFKNLGRLVANLWCGQGHCQISSVYVTETKTQQQQQLLYRTYFIW